MRIVLDTNVLIGALITKGTPPDMLYQAWTRGQFQLVTSTIQIEELNIVLNRPRLRNYLDPDEAAIIVENIDTRALILEDLPYVELSPDAKDNHILATAIAAKADLIVSGDKRDLLVLGQVQGIPIVGPRDALAYLTSHRS